MWVEDERGGEDVDDEGCGDAVEKWFWWRDCIVVEGWRGGGGGLLQPEEVEVVLLEAAEAVAVKASRRRRRRRGWWRGSEGEWGTEPGGYKVGDGSIGSEQRGKGLEESLGAGVGEVAGAGGLWGGCGGGHGGLSQ